MKPPRDPAPQPLRLGRSGCWISSRPSTRCSGHRFALAVAVREVERARFTVAEKIELLLESVPLGEEAAVAFEELFAGDASREEVVVTFLALLEWSGYSGSGPAGGILRPAPRLAGGSGVGGQFVWAGRPCHAASGRWTPAGIGRSWASHDAFRPSTKSAPPPAQLPLLDGAKPGGPARRSRRC